MSPPPFVAKQWRRYVEPNFLAMKPAALFAMNVTNMCRYFF
jgi:hypothetical protein